MPFAIRKEGGEKPFKVINKTTGRVVGSTTSRKKAQQMIVAIEISERKKDERF